MLLQRDTNNPSDYLTDPEAPDQLDAAASDVSRRLERFERTRDTTALWPGLTEAARVAAAREIERVTRERLGGALGVRIDPAGIHDAYALGIAGHTTGMGPVVGRWAEDGLVTGPPEVLRAFGRHLTHARRRTARMEREVLPALDGLIARGITPMVLKGFHTGRVYFEEPGVRRMTDIDVLVPPQRVEDAEAALVAAGFRPDAVARRPYQREWIGPRVDPRLFSVELADERSRWILELHASLDRNYYAGAVARLDAERALDEPFEVVGRRMLVPSPPLLLVILACHCAQELDGTRLLRLVEMVRIIRTETSAGRLDWDEVLAILQRTGAARFTYPALALVEDLAPGTVDRRVLAMALGASTWAARHTVARLVPAGGSLDARGVLRQLMWSRGPVAIVERLLRNVWPPSFVRPKDVFPGWRVHLRRLRTGMLSLRAPDERRGERGARG
jgi:hypothetical protein